MQHSIQYVACGDVETGAYDYIALWMVAIGMASYCTLSDPQPPRKRRRTDSSASPRTPPTLENEPSRDSCVYAGHENPVPDKGTTVKTALHVLRTEAAAIANITAFYTTSPTAQTSLQEAITSILDAQRSRNRLIVCGVGKSAFIAQKFVATCKSLSIAASFLHACEAVHGDLGDVRERDVVMFVSYSGRTPELLNVLPYLPEDVRIIALSGQTKAQDCRLLDGQDEDCAILLPAPVHETEEASFGVSAPTTSTTVALAVTDMLALVLAEQIHGVRKRQVFAKNHPGGAIGMGAVGKGVKRAKEVDVTALELPSPSISGEDDR